MSSQTLWETVEVKGSEVLEKIKELVAEGNTRRVRIRQKDRVIAEFPLTMGVVGGIIAPVLAAVGAIAALMQECTIEVERVTPPATEAAPASQPSGVAS